MARRVTTGPAREDGDSLRTCVGCRGRAERADLLRVVAVEDSARGRVLVPDPRRVQPGRGASVHPDLACLDLAERRRTFPRALRLPGPVDVAPVRAHLQSVNAETEAGRASDEPSMNQHR